MAIAFHFACKQAVKLVQVMETHAEFLKSSPFLPVESNRVIQLSVAESISYPFTVFLDALRSVVGSIEINTNIQTCGFGFFNIGLIPVIYSDFAVGVVPYADTHDNELTSCIFHGFKVDIALPC